MIRISVTGPESTGKSWLAEHLASHYQTLWVPEFAREYLAGLDREYDQGDILKIALGQVNAEEERWKLANRYLFCDTDPLVTKIWSDVKYGVCDSRILSLVEHHTYDLYLLCDIDLPWEYDPLREHPDMRQYLFDLYFQELTNRKLPLFVISGFGEERLKNAAYRIDAARFP